MKTSFVTLLAILLATAIMVPSIITLTKMEKDSVICMDFNDEEKKEEKKETGEKDLIFISHSYLSSISENSTSPISCVYIESHCTYTAKVFLPPPKFIG